jgi:hypothetical protein
MLGHLAETPTRWPENAIYCHSCITALRSVTLLLQEALRHQEGFDAWYADVQARLAADPEFEYLKHARNYVLKEGALEIQGSYRIEWGSLGGLPGLEIRGIGPQGPDVWALDPAAPDTDVKVPVDWRRVPGFEFDVKLRLAAVPGLPEPPERELKEMLADKIRVLEKVHLDAVERFDPDHWDPGPGDLA